MFLQEQRIKRLDEDHQGTRLLLDNSLLQLQRQKLDMDGHIRILNSRVDRRRRDVAALEARLDNLEATNALLTANVAALDPCLCRCGQEDGEREESSPSSYQTPPVAQDENEEPLPVRISTVREGQLVPVVEQKEVDELFRAIDREREADLDNQEELSVRSPNHQRRRVRIRRRTQVLHAMSTAINVQPRVPFRRINGVKGAVRRD